MIKRKLYKKSSGKNTVCILERSKNLEEGNSTYLFLRPEMYCVLSVWGATEELIENSVSEKQKIQVLSEHQKCKDGILRKREHAFSTMSKSLAIPGNTLFRADFKHWVRTTEIIKMQVATLYVCRLRVSKWIVC